ncbi:MAG: alpha/beta hydrolase [Planctomycetes bacterium]|nr:alpha/beta hydrolase [Planctomycetota bacterium]
MKRDASFQWFSTAALLGLALLAGPSHGQQPAGNADDVAVERDEENEIVRVKIPARNGKVAWSDILRALMQTGELNDEAVKSKLPSGTLDITGSSSRFVLLGVNSVLGPDIRMQIISGRAGDAGAYLLVTIDQGALREKRRRVSKQLRETLGTDGDRQGRTGETFGLQLKPGWEQTDESMPLVIVVHGFNSSPMRFDSLVDALGREGLAGGTFSYADDQPIADSAVQLSTELKALAAGHPGRKIALVTHSMGGLVSRAAIEDPAMDPGNVTKLIMVAPPTQGSLLAHFAFGLDILDHAFPASERADVSRFYAAVADGLHEAAIDLRPGSRFLRQLNARPRNPRVTYSIFLGSGGRFTQERLNDLRKKLELVERESEVAGLFTMKLDEILADLDEVVRGKGDGVVAIKRGRLEGVEDTQVLGFTHLEALQKVDKLQEQPLFEAVLARLRK